MQHNKKKTHCYWYLHYMTQFSIPVGDFASVPGTHHNKAFDKTETLDLKNSQKARIKSESEILGMATVCVHVCVFACACECIKLLSGITLTPLHKANLSAVFRQAVSQRLISYFNRHQRTMSERQTKTRDGPVAVLKIYSTSKTNLVRI